MNVWQAIKKELTDGKIGKDRIVAICRAATLFISIAPDLRNGEASIRAFGRDGEVTRAIIDGGFIEKLRDNGVL